MVTSLYEHGEAAQGEPSTQNQALPYISPLPHTVKADTALELVKLDKVCGLLGLAKLLGLLGY